MATTDEGDPVDENLKNDYNDKDMNKLRDFTGGLYN